MSEKDTGRGPVLSLLKNSKIRKNKSALKGNESKFRGFIENLPVMFYAVEPQPPYAPFYVSPAFESLGYPLEDWADNP
jgi:hypothetical protein